MIEATFTADDLELMGELAARHGQGHDLREERLVEIARAAQDLSPEVRKTTTEYLLDRSGDGILLMTGIPTDFLPVPATPETPTSRPLPDGWDVVALLCAALIGEVFGYEAYQDGRLVHDVLPLRECEDKQLSTGSAVELDLHVEEAFTTLAPDYLGFLGLRGLEEVPTCFSSIASIDTAGDWTDILFEPISVDDDNREAGQEQGVGSMAVLYGDRDEPYMNLDAYYFKVSSPEHQKALDRLCAEIAAAQVEMRLTTGQMAFIDNRRVAHGRPPFRALYDGTDRYLRRVVVSRSLRSFRGQMKLGARLLP